MRVTEAFILIDVSVDDKRKLEEMNIPYSTHVHGYAVTRHQYDQLFGKGSPTTSSSKNMDIQIENLTFEWKITGKKTYDYRQIFKDFGGKFKSDDKSWRIPREEASEEEIWAKIREQSA